MTINELDKSAALVKQNHVAGLLDELATGLGLAIVKVFTEADRGKATGECPDGIGSTFRFSLPTTANGTSRANR